MFLLFPLDPSQPPPSQPSKSTRQTSFRVRADLLWRLKLLETDGPVGTSTHTARMVMWNFQRVHRRVASIWPDLNFQNQSQKVLLSCWRIRDLSWRSLGNKQFVSSLEFWSTDKFVWFLRFWIVAFLYTWTGCNVLKAENYSKYRIPLSCAP